MLLVLSFLGGKNEGIGARIALTLIYTALFIPFIYLMDRVQYRQYLRRTGQAEPARPARPARGARTTESAKPNAKAAGDAEPTGRKPLGAGLLRGRRR
jgi:hypothetical protein